MSARRWYPGTVRVTVRTELTCGRCSFTNDLYPFPAPTLKESLDDARAAGWVVGTRRRMPDGSVRQQVLCPDCRLPEHR